MFTLIGLCKSGWVQRSHGTHKTDTPILNWKKKQTKNGQVLVQFQFLIELYLNYICCGYFRGTRVIYEQIRKKKNLVYYDQGCEFNAFARCCFFTIPCKKMHSTEICFVLLYSSNSKYFCLFNGVGHINSCFRDLFVLSVVDNLLKLIYRYQLVHNENNHICFSLAFHK